MTQEQIYDRINHLCSLGYMVPVEVKGVARESLYGIFGPAKDKFENWRFSSYWLSVEEAKQYLGGDTGIDQDDFCNENSSKEFAILEDEIYRLEYDLPKVGDKMLVRKNAKEKCEKFGFGWSEDQEAMIGNIWEMKKVWNNLFVTFHDNVGYQWDFPLSALLPISPEPTLSKEDWIKQGEQYGYVREGKVID